MGSNKKPALESAGNGIKEFSRRQSPRDDRLTPYFWMLEYAVVTGFIASEATRA
jgi:hypothetical protein